MAVKLTVIETKDVDIEQETDTIRLIEVKRAAGNPKDFREEAIKLLQDRLSLTYFELSEVAIIELGDDRIVAKNPLI